MITLGTRGSALGLVQAGMAEEALRAAWPGLEIRRRVIKTTGDRRTDVPLSEVAQAGGLDKGASSRNWRRPCRRVKSMWRCIV